MYIKNIRLTNFRNYGRIDLDVGPSVNIIYGNNAQGKTNLIEAINVCSCISSHRTSKDRDLIKFGEKEYITELLLHDDEYDTDTSISASFYTEESEDNPNSTAKRELKHDGIAVDKISEYMGICNTVIFAPEDLNLVKGAPASRRKFLNMLISKVSPTYYDALNRTNRVINQKNVSLKSFKGDIKKADDNVLDFWDFSLADLSAEMIMFRYRFTELLSRKASSHHSVISDGKEVLNISYSTIGGAVELLERSFESEQELHMFITGTLSEAIYARIKGILSEYILSKLKASRKYDVEKGISMSGIHRDDLDIKLDGLSMKNYSSQGQQRSAALSLKLAELQIIKDFTRSAPILLLDDVFSELDSGRRVSLLSGMKDAQIFITCTDREYIENELAKFLMTDIEPVFFRVTSGSCIREE